MLLSSLTSATVAVVTGNVNALAAAQELCCGKMLLHMHGAAKKVADVGTPKRVGYEPTLPKTKQRVSF